jgi:hypothetical protein
MKKEDFLKALADIETAKEAFDYLESISDGTIERYVKMFGLPMEYNSIHYVQKLRCCLMNAVSYYFGVGHLGGAKFQALGLQELKVCQQKAQSLIDFDVSEYNRMYAFLSTI